MRKIAAVSLVALLALAGCSGGKAEPSSTAGGKTAPRTVEVEGQKVTIEGDPGAAPILRFDKPLNIAESKVYPVSKGNSSTKLTEGQLLGVNYVLASAKDGSDQHSTWAQDRPEAMIMSKNAIAPDLFEALQGGSVFAEALQTLPASQQSPTPLLAFLEVDSAQTIPAQASGAKKTVPETMPQVTVAKDGKPSVTIPQGEAPKDLQTAVSIEGDGDYVDAGDAIAVHYTGWLWDGGKQFDSSWDRAVPFTLSLGQGSVIKGWDEGLAKKKVGSQVVLVIPPNLAYGEQAQGSIPANSTLVFVVDILGKV